MKPFQLLLFLQLIAATIPTSHSQPIRRINQTQVANYTEFLPCLNEMPSSLIPFAQEYRKRTREPLYTNLPCAPPKCFRSVLDGYDHLLELALEDMADQVAQVMYEQGLVSLDKSPIQSSIRRKQTFSGRSQAVNRDPFEQFHMDYFEVPAYVVTGLLYREPTPTTTDQIVLQGGETCFADAFSREEDGGGDTSTGTKTLQKGLLVEPKKGRLLLFSGGGENFHGPLPIRNPDQQRPTFILFFKCQDEEVTEEGEEL